MLLVTAWDVRSQAYGPCKAAVAAAAADRLSLDRVGGRAGGHDQRGVGDRDRAGVGARAAAAARRIALDAGVLLVVAGVDGGSAIRGAEAQTRLGGRRTALAGAEADREAARAAAAADRLGQNALGHGAAGGDRGAVVDRHGRPGVARAAHPALGARGRRHPRQRAGDRKAARAAAAADGLRQNAHGLRPEVVIWPVIGSRTLPTVTVPATPPSRPGRLRRPRRRCPRRRAPARARREAAVAAVAADGLGDDAVELVA